jgi:hypothetical protein
MDAETLTKEWGLITGLLPPQWRELARTTGVFRRSRKVADPDTLLFLILLHVAAGLSLRQAVARARRMGLANISDVGLLKRLRSAAPWLHALAVAMFEAGPFRRGIDAFSSGRRVRVVDATHVSEPGSTGTDWKIHYVLQLPSLECDYFEITGASGGETYKRLPIEQGDLILGDRGYAHREGVAHVLDSGGDVIVRLNRTNFPLLDKVGNRVDLLVLLRGLVNHQPGEWSVSFDAYGRRYPARLCAIRKSVAATERTRARLVKEARKRQRQLQPETLEVAEYTMVLTTLSKDIEKEQILELYRSRWQIELAFKRMKSLFSAGHVPKYDPQSARAWLHAKLLAVLLIERLSEEARLFSPWGFQLPAAK